MIDIKKVLKENDVIYGRDRVIKGITSGHLKQVILSDNCSESVKEEIERYCAISKIPVEVLEVSNDELGTISKKPFSISVLGY